MHPMNRREAIKTTSVFLGGVFVVSSGFLTACEPGSDTSTGKVLNAQDEALIEDIADTLLPTTPGSPGAKAARVGPTINLLLTECYEADEQKRVVAGLKQFRDTVGDHFASMSQQNRENWVRRVANEAKTAGDKHYFGLVRELSLRAYFTSEIGMTKALRYVMTPGRWVGCVEMTPGQPAWG